MSPARNVTAGYESVVSGGLKFAGVDQGIDFTGTGTVHALGDGIIERVTRGGSGWPGIGAFLLYRITDGPAKGRRVYVAEDFHIATSLRPGMSIRKGDALGTVHSSYPGIEMGWAQANGSPVAPLNPNPHSPKPAGKDFDTFVRGLAGAASAVGASIGAAVGGGDTSTSSGDGADLSAAQAAGCATTLALMLCTVGAAVGMFYATGAPWPF